MTLKYYGSLFVGILISSLILIASCKDDEETLVSNEIALSGLSEQTLIEGEGEGTVTVTYTFAASARQSGSLTINAEAENLNYDVNYTTTPSESSGSIEVPFEQGDVSVSFVINVVDDNVNRSDGSVTFTLATITGETANISPSASTFKLVINDNEGESIILQSTEALAFGDVIPGTSTASREVVFTTMNVVADINVTASTGFTVSATADGTYAGTTNLDPTATSFFVRAEPASDTPLGQLIGTATISAAEASTIVNMTAIVANVVGELFWAENFDYEITDAEGAYPAYLDTYPNINEQVNWGILPVSAKFRAAANYNGSDGTSTGSGLARSGHLDTWYLGNRFYGIAMGDGPLTFNGYPASGVGRTARLKQDYSNITSRPSTAANNPCGTEGEFSSKNSLMVRRFVENGEEIKSGAVFVSAMIKVNQVFDEITPVLKNAVFMLTGDANFVNDNAMKLNIRNNGQGGFNFGVSKSGDDGAVVYGSTDYSLNTTYVVIMKVDIREDLEGEVPNDEVSVYVYKPGDEIPTYESGTAVAEAKVDINNQDAVDRHDVTSGLETFFFREIADVFAAGSADDVRVHDVEFSGIRIATSWSALFLDASSARHDNIPSDPLQTKNYGQIGCATVGGPEKLGNNDQ